MTPGDAEWTKLMTASKVAAVLGLSPWQSPYSLWHEMRGDVERPETNDQQRRGTYLEAGVLAWWRDQHPDIDDWTDQPEYALGDWAAATPDRDAFIDCEHENRGDCTNDCHVLVEAKTASYDDDWGDPGTDAIPAYYYAQVMWQMHVSGIHTCYIPVLTSRLRFAEYVVHYDADDGAAMERLCREFYDSLSGAEPPALDESVATFNTVKALHKDIDKGVSVEAPAELAHNLVNGQHAYKQAETSARLAKSLAIAAIGRAQYLTYQGVKIARRQADGPDRTKFVVVGKPEHLTDISGDDAA